MCKISRILFAILISGLIPHESFSQNKDTVDVIFDSYSHDTVLCKKLLALSKSLHNSGNYPLAIKAADYSLDIYTKIKNIPGQYASLERLTLTSVKENDTSNAKLHLQAMYDIAVKTKSLKHKNGAMVLEARMNYQLSNFDKAISLAQLVIESSEELFDSVLVPKAYILIANIYLKQGSYKKASEYYLPAIKIVEATKDTSTMAVCYTNLGTINRFLYNCNDAVYFHLKALALSKIINDINGIANAYATLGDSYGCLKNSDSAIYCFKTAIPFLIQMKNFSALCTAYGNLGNRFVEDNQLDSGLFYLGKANETFLLAGDSFSIAGNTWAIGDAFMSKYNQTKDHTFLNKAMQAFTSSEQIAARFHLESLKTYVFKSLSKVHEIKGNTKAALLYLQKYNLINDSMLSSDLTSQIAEMQTKYESEKKDKEIIENKLQMQQDELTLTKKTNTNRMLTAGIAALVLLGIAGTFAFKQRQKLLSERKEIEKQKALEQTRAAIARDLHDDIGATLSSVQLMSSFASTAIDKDAPGAKQWVQKIGDNTGDILQNIRDIVWTMNPDNDKAEELILRMKQFAVQMLEPKNIRFVFMCKDDVPRYLNTLAAKRNVFLIFKEAINNAAKYSQCSELKLSMEMNNNKCMMNITDNGKGYNTASASTGSGTGNMHKRAAELNGKLDIISSETEGTSITLVC